MAMELIKKQVQLSEKTAQEIVQNVKERDLIIPDGKPDMQRVMYVDGKIKMEQMDVQEGRVVYKGQVELIVLYAPENNPNGVCRVKGTIPLEDFIIMDEINPNKAVDMKHEIEHLHWSITNERKLNVKAIIKMIVDVASMKDIELVTEAIDDMPMEVQTKTMQAVKPMDSGQEESMIKDELTIPQGKPSMNELLNVCAHIKEEQVKRTEDEIIYSGMVEVCVMYSGQDDESTVQVIRQSIPFNYSVDVPKAPQELYWGYDMSVEPSYVQIMPDYDGEDRILDVECTMTMEYTTYEQVEETVLDDVYAPGKKIKMKQNKENYMTMAGKTNVKMPKKDVLTTEHMLTEIDNIFNVELKPIIDEQEVVDDKLTINGMVEAKMIYVTPEEPNKVQTMVEMVPFSEQIQVPGMTNESIVNVAVKPKNANVSLYNKNDMMLEYMMDYDVDAFNEEELNVVESVEMTDLTTEELNSNPSIAVYVVKKGDSLWSIAKKYNTTVKDILEINDIEHPSAIYPGQKIIIMKKNNLNTPKPQK